MFRLLKSASLHEGLGRLFLKFVFAAASGERGDEPLWLSVMTFYEVCNLLSNYERSFGLGARSYIPK